MKASQIHALRLSRLALVSLACQALLGLACGGSVQSAKTEDEARAMVPVPICVQRMPRSAAPGTIISLRPEEYWTLILPSFDAEAKTIDPSAVDCSGRASLESLSRKGVNSVSVDPERMLIAPGADGMKIVWLETHPLEGGAYAGLLALTRQVNSYLEVYAVGIHRGKPEGSRFSLERMGPKIVISATEEECHGEAEARRCNASNSVYLMATGALLQAATYPVDRALEAAVPGKLGVAEYRFTASAEYRPDVIALSEHLSVRSKSQGEIRSSDLERAFRLEKGQLVATGDSLWTKTLKELGVQP
jgi:hypothetical protein